jgi:hypothetical protein
LDAAPGTQTHELHQVGMWPGGEAEKFISLFADPPNGHRLKPDFTEYSRNLQVTTKPGQTVAFMVPLAQPGNATSGKNDSEKYLIAFVTAEEVKGEVMPSPKPTSVGTNR